ncbi:23S rRNA (adenine(1618)-N(6))-methyltransferase RlmF [Saprospiraceae bacterium]|nr:23S rRNA (adenine(1618)-N(6))-methyltransferase RlmF [Saprospiraceae bacterium]
MPKTKPKLHPRSKHQGDYSFELLAKANPELKGYVHIAKSGRLSITFHDPQAVKELNKALLFHFYKLTYWDIPDGYLCPGVPGRAEYIHHIADLLKESNTGKAIKNSNISGLDIGTGASCIYPIIAASDYQWTMVGSDIDATAIQTCTEVIEKNEILKSKVKVRQQKDKKSIFNNIINSEDYFDFTICNPPFFSSQEEARVASDRKNNNLRKTDKESKNNFGGTASELWCDGGEYVFVRQMIHESKKHTTSCYWFTSLISNVKHVAPLENELSKLDCNQSKVIDIMLGNKKTRILCWSFLSEKQMVAWRELRW